MSRSTPSPTRAQAAAFDFDVVSDVPPPPLRKPAAAQDGAPPQPVPAHEPAKTAEA